MASTADQASGTRNGAPMRITKNPSNNSAPYESTVVNRSLVVVGDAVAGFMAGI